MASELGGEDTELKKDLQGPDKITNNKPRWGAVYHKEDKIQFEIKMRNLKHYNIKHKLKTKLLWKPGK